MVAHPADNWRLASVRVPAGDRRLEVTDSTAFFYPTLVQMLLSTDFCPPPPPRRPPTPNPPKLWYPVRGIKALKSKNPLGDCFVGENNDFTRGLTSNIMPWGMLGEPPPKRGVYGVRTYA